MTRVAPAVLVALALAVAPAPAVRRDPVRIFLHYQSPADRPLVDAIADTLEVFDYVVADKRLVSHPTAGDIRFFHDADRDVARHVKSIVDSVLRTQGRAMRIGLLDRRGVFDTAAHGLIEIWVPRQASRRGDG